ncbi:MAG: ATP-dependent sacrificial sulfur transferase LarE [Clostridiales bacterium]|nr:ATP-dependent sacrificial sulfur transferase LarE [Clostridiales bacterium]
MSDTVQYVTCGQMKELEEKADGAGLSYYQMMENAGGAAAEYITEHWDKCSVEVFCGKGNNGGDGFVVARKLYVSGYNVTVILVDGEPVTPDAIINYELVQRLPVEIVDMSDPGGYMSLFSEAPHLIVDAVYGTGFRGHLQDNGLKAAMYINKHKSLGTRIISLDIPSGLGGDMMEIEPECGDAVRADVTIAFHAGKPVHLADGADAFCGETVIADIGIDEAIEAAEAALEEVQNPEEPLPAEEPAEAEPVEEEAGEEPDPEEPEPAETETPAVDRKKLKKLEEILDGYGSMLLALSGGVDSVFLLAFAYRHWGDDRIAAVTATGPYFDKEEVEYAREICSRLGISHKIFDAGYVLDMVKDNPEDRCYCCKREIFSAVRSMARMAGSTAADGTNVDDTEDYRPGCRALQELEIASPLLEAGLTKAEIREALKEICEEDREIGKALEFTEMGRPVNIWEKPAFACLASRIPYGEEINERKLEAIRISEQWLKVRGFDQVRVRCHEISGTTPDGQPAVMARIELLPEDIERFLCLKDDAEWSFRRMGFSYVTLDLGGYEKGKMNRGIPEGTPAAAATGERLQEQETVVRGRSDSEAMEALHKQIDDFIRETENRDYTFSDLVEIIGRLREPDGCPWDREQTHESLKKHLVEEANEALEAIDEGDMDHLCEELGDVLLQVVLHARIASEDGAFTIDDVIRKEASKMVRRHPHVFGDIKVDGLEEQLDLWEEIKKREKLLK